MLYVLNKMCIYEIGPVLVPDDHVQTAGNQQRQPVPGICTGYWLGAYGIRLVPNSLNLHLQIRSRQGWIC